MRRQASSTAFATAAFRPSSPPRNGAMSTTGTAPSLMTGPWCHGAHRAASEACRKPGRQTRSVPACTTGVPASMCWRPETRPITTGASKRRDPHRPGDPFRARPARQGARRAARARLRDRGLLGRRRRRAAAHERRPPRGIRRGGGVRRADERLRCRRAFLPAGGDRLDRRADGGGRAPSRHLPRRPDHGPRPRRARLSPPGRPVRGRLSADLPGQRGVPRVPVALSTSITGTARASTCRRGRRCWRGAASSRTRRSALVRAPSAFSSTRR